MLRAACLCAVAWLDQLLTGLGPLAEQAHDLEIADAVRRVIQRHGPGPYSPEDLAAIAGIVDVDALRRVLGQMVADGLGEAAP